MENKQILPVNSLSPPPGPLAVIKLIRFFDDVLKLKKGSKFKKYFDKHYYEACFETPFSGSVIGLFVYQPSKNTLRSYISPGFYKRKSAVDHFFVLKRWLFHLRAN